MVAQNPANYPAIKNLSRCLKHASVLLAVGNETVAQRIITFILCHAVLKTTIRWCDSIGAVIQCWTVNMFSATTNLMENDPENFRGTSNQSIHKLADKLKTTASLIDEEPDR